MAGRILLLSSLLFATLFFVHPVQAQKVIGIPFTEKDGLVYIHVKVNGVLATALVDSGASVTNIDASLVESKGCAYRNVFTASGDKVVGCERKVDIQAGGLLVASRVTAYHFPASFGGLKVILALRDLACGGRVTFDYENQVLILSPPKK